MCLDLAGRRCKPRKSLIHGRHEPCLMIGDKRQFLCRSLMALAELIYIVWSCRNRGSSCRKAFHWPLAAIEVVVMVMMFRTVANHLFLGCLIMPASLCLQAVPRNTWLDREFAPSSTYQRCVVRDFKKTQMYLFLRFNSVMTFSAHLQSIAKATLFSPLTCERLS